MTACIAAAVAVILASATALPAQAATSASYSNEVGGTGVAVRANTELLNSAWLASVSAAGGVAQAPSKLPAGTITSLPVAADGTSTLVTRTRYSTDTSPAYVAPSPSQGEGTCFANGAGPANAGAGQQGNAPRPTALVGGNTTCTNGFAYGESGGAGEGTTRDAVEFTFSRPVLGFGAWFGDLETRTDGQGVPAVVRLYGVGNVLISDQPVVPGPSYLPQSLCGGSYTGCGNNTTRWLGFVADPAAPVVRMVVIVGDDDAVGDATEEGMSFVGATFDLSTASISLVKNSDPLTDTNSDGLVGAGDTIYYNFLVTNTGTLAVSSVAITDAAASGISCPSGALAAAASRTCTGSHLVTQAEANAAEVSNTATATAAVYGGTITSAPSTHVTVVPRVAGLAIVKLVSGATYSAVGDVRTYATTVTNSGNVTLTGVSVSEPAPGLGQFSTNCGAINATLQPRDTLTCQSSYTITQADIDAGTLVSTVSTSGTVPTGAVIGPISGAATSTAVQVVSLVLTKTVTEQTFDQVGDVLHYTVSVLNAGNVTLSDLAVIDPSPGSGVFSTTCPAIPPTLTPGATATCTATYVIAQSDLDARAVTNLADASAVDPMGVKHFAPQAMSTSTAVVTGELAIVKSVDKLTFDAVGDELTFTVTVTNNANTVASLVVTDTNPGSGAFGTTCGVVAALAPAASVQCTATYVVTQADLDAGSVINLASATGTAGGTTVSSPTARAESTGIIRKALLLVKTPNVESFSTVGQVISYTLQLTNQGNVTLSSPQIVDSNPGSGAFVSDCGPAGAALAPGASTSCQASYTVTQLDIDTGSLTNTAQATAVPPLAAVLISPEVAVVTPAVQLYSLVLTKAVTEPSFAAVGDQLHYSLTFTNSGNTTLTQAAIADAAPGAGSFVGDCAQVSATLAPGAFVSCVAVYTVTQNDLDTGTVTNTAQGAADDPLGNERLSNEAQATTTASIEAAFTLTKVATESTYRTVGDVLHFAITLTNTGNVSLTSTTVSDSTPGDGTFSTNCGVVADALVPGASRVCQASYTITSIDLARNGVTNAASAVAVAAGGAVVAVVKTDATVTRGAPVLALTGESGLAPALAALALLLGGVLLQLRSTRRRLSAKSPMV